MLFTHTYEHDLSGTEQTIQVTSLPHCRIEVTVRTDAPKAKTSATIQVPRSRVLLLVRELQQWLAATKDQRE